MEKGRAYEAKGVMELPIGKRGYLSLTAGVVLLSLLSIQGCMPSPTSLSAGEVFALSASALWGSENYSFNGEVAVLGPGGFAHSRAEYEGEVTLHGNLKMQWKSAEAMTMSAQSQPKIAYKPLQLLESFKNNSAMISYAAKPVPSEPVQLQIKLDDTVAKARIVEGLRAEFALLSADKDLLRTEPSKVNSILSAANKRLEKVLSTLKVTTICHWTADPKSWFPHRLTEETVLKYTWGNKPCEEKRISETNFLHNVRGDTIGKSDKDIGKGDNQ